MGVHFIVAPRLDGVKGPLRLLLSATPPASSCSAPVLLRMSKPVMGPHRFLGPCAQGRGWVQGAKQHCCMQKMQASADTPTAVVGAPNSHRTCAATTPPHPAPHLHHVVEPGVDKVGDGVAIAGGVALDRGAHAVVGRLERACAMDCTGQAVDD